MANLTKAQQRKIEAVKSFDPSAKVIIETESFLKHPRVFIEWAKDGDKLYGNHFMAKKGERGGFKILSAYDFLSSSNNKAHQRVIASLALYDLGIRGTIALV